MNDGDPSALLSLMSTGLLVLTACGIGFSPSASMSRPVSTVSTPEERIAAATSIDPISACACGERTITA